MCCGADMAHVSRKEADKIVAFVRRMLNLLHMPLWTILVMEEPSEEGTLACIDVVDQRYVAQLYLCERWKDLPKHTKIEVLVHETLHLIHVRVNDVFDDAADYMHAHEHTSLRRRYRRETELMVDHLAKFIAGTHKVEEAYDDSH